MAKCKILFSFFILGIFSLCLQTTSLMAIDLFNQTHTLSPIYPGNNLPFRIEIIQADFELPEGFHSGVVAAYHDKWLFFAGRTNGMHPFRADGDNFPVQSQNPWVYVVNPKTKDIKRRSLLSPDSGLNQKQIDLLTVTSPQFYQEGKMLYITGGYGIDSETGKFDTKDALTAVNVPGLISWVERSSPNCHTQGTAADHIRQVFDPTFRVTGGYMNRAGNNDTLLIFGQDFDGLYFPNSDGKYTKEIRRFQIIDEGFDLSVKIKPSEPRNPSYRRRDLNVIPAIHVIDDKVEPYFIAFSGVFTQQTGAWTVPVVISPEGNSHMSDPSSPTSFKQGMNNYISAFIGLFSKDYKEMYTILLGGISFGYFDNGVFKTDDELPFINQTTVIRRDQNGRFTQFLLEAEYPFIPAQHVNAGNPLLFGANAVFIPCDSIPRYSNDVIKLDRLKSPVLLGYIFGGIQSSLPNTETQFDSQACPYIFKVRIIPN